MAEIKGYCKEHDLKFDKDLLFGKIGEKLANDIFEGNLTAEVKTERDIWVTTGNNVCIEFKSRGKPSGIATTKSEIWIHWLSVNGKIRGGYIFKVKQLKEYLRKNFHRLERNRKVKVGGDDNTSDIILLDKNEINEIYRMEE